MYIKNTYIGAQLFKIFKIGTQYTYSFRIKLYVNWVPKLMNGSLFTYIGYQKAKRIKKKGTGAAVTLGPWPGGLGGETKFVTPKPQGSADSSTLRGNRRPLLGYSEYTCSVNARS